MSQTAISINSNELEALIRRVMREEFVRILQRPAPSLPEDWKHEGADDPEGDRRLLHDALDVLRRHKKNPDAWTDWEDFEAELEKTEASDELSD